MGKADEERPLDGLGVLQVRWALFIDGLFVEIEDYGQSSHIWLSPKAALTLFHWLEQQRVVLEKAASAQQKRKDRRGGTPKR